MYQIITSYIFHTYIYNSSPRVYIAQYFYIKFSKVLKDRNLFFWYSVMFVTSWKK